MSRLKDRKPFFPIRLLDRALAISQAMIELSDIWHPRTKVVWCWDMILDTSSLRQFAKTLEMIFVSILQRLMGLRWDISFSFFSWE